MAAMDTIKHRLNNIDLRRPAFIRLDGESRSRFLAELGLLLRAEVRAYEHQPVRQDRNLDAYLRTIGAMESRWGEGRDYRGSIEQGVGGRIGIGLGEERIAMAPLRSGYFRGARGVALVHATGDGVGERYRLTALLPNP